MSSSLCFVKDDQVQVIYNGVDNAVYQVMDASAVRDQFGIAQDALVIGMVGSVNAWKGQGDFLEAVTPILQANPKAVAFLAGSAFEGEEWRVEELEKAISDSPVAGQIKRIDYYSKTTELYNMFDIFVLPSTNPDPLPTVVLEAMACGKPVVGYRHGGVCEMVKEGENGLLAHQINLLNYPRLFKNWLRTLRRENNLERHLLNAKKNYSHYKVIFGIFRVV